MLTQSEKRFYGMECQGIDFVRKRQDGQEVVNRLACRADTNKKIPSNNHQEKLEERGSRKKEALPSITYFFVSLT